MQGLRKKDLLWQRRFIDDTFIIIRKKANSEEILNILNSYHKDIQFISVKEESEQLAFFDLDVKLHEEFNFILCFRELYLFSSYTR